jgi:hypothetical protein
VDDRSRVVLAAVIGAIAGGVAGYLFLTEDGRRVRARLEPGMEDLVGEVRRLRGAVDSARVVAREGWGAIQDLRRSVPDLGNEWPNTGRPPSPF